MDTEHITIKIASLADSKMLVAEMWFQNTLIAEVNQETDCFEIELYVSEPLRFSLEDFQKALETAKSRLMK